MVEHCCSGSACVHVEAGRNDPSDGPTDTGRRGFLVKLVAAGATLTVPVPASAGWDDWFASFVSDQQLTMMADQTWTAIRQDVPLSTDAALIERVEAIGRRIAAQIGDQRAWKFSVLRSDQLNAFALPNGQVAFYEGILGLMENDAQIATVMGHEIAHVTGRHAAERVGTGTAANLGMQALAWALQMGDVSFAREIAAVLGAGVQYGVLMPYNRGQELEADRIGLGYMARAGFDPRQSIPFWSRMASKKTGEPPEFLSTHPSDARRINELERILPEVIPLYRQATG
jgi:predicted Zn-dependent protease